MNQEALDVLVQQHSGRVAQLGRNGRVVGYLFAYDSTTPRVSRRWWRRAAPERPALGWLIEWTEPPRGHNGYTEEAGIAGPDDVAEVVRDWDVGRHDHKGELLDVAWLGDADAADIASRYGW